MSLVIGKCLPPANGRWSIEYNDVNEYEIHTERDECSKKDDSIIGVPHAEGKRRSVGQGQSEKLPVVYVGSHEKRIRRWSGLHKCSCHWR
jgi:hypothetical protein